MIKSPPPRDDNVFTKITEAAPEQIREYFEFMTPVDSKGRYLHYDKLRFRIPSNLDPKLVWSMVKAARGSQLRPIITVGHPLIACSLHPTAAIHMAVSEADRHTTTAMLQWMSKQIGEDQHMSYLLNDLIQDEAISSSQLEGAATTTTSAKDMLRRGRAPRTPDEKMILGNFKMMHCAWKARNKPLTPELILELHSTGVEGINDEKYHPGTFRVTDDVVVEDGLGNVVHTPPPAKGLEHRLESVAKWINTNHSDISAVDYYHPLLKAIVLHFVIGYEHPFRDGNGRVARSLFYWYLFKHGYDAFRYITISTYLKTAFAQYGKSYLYTETDDMDLTYFVDFQARIVIRAIDEFRQSYEKAASELKEFNQFIFSSGLIKTLSEKQRIVLHVAKTKKAKFFTATNVQNNLDCSYNTASSVLNGLVKHKLFQKRKDGREWVYSMIPPKDIIQNWETD